MELAYPLIPSSTRIATLMLRQCRCLSSSQRSAKQRLYLLPVVVSRRCGRRAVFESSVKHVSTLSLGYLRRSMTQKPCGSKQYLENFGSPILGCRRRPRSPIVTTRISRVDVDHWHRYFKIGGDRENDVWASSTVFARKPSTVGSVRSSDVQSSSSEAKEVCADPGYDV